MVYVVRSEVSNEGMKYTDTFVVVTQFCVFQCDPEHTSLRATAEIKYVKSVNAIAKGKTAMSKFFIIILINLLAFIEKNAYGSIEGGVQNLCKCRNFRYISNRKEKP